jgi:RNA polymerase sigma-70 factor (ECF subfamily)
MPSDEELMTAVAGGDLAAFEQIVLRHQAEAWRVAWRFTDDAIEAEDLVQEAFLRILDAVPRYSPTASFRTYLYRILNRLCIDHVRKIRPSITDSLPQTADGSPSPAQQASLTEREALIRDVLDSLPADHRMAVVLRYFEGLKVIESLEFSRKALQEHLTRVQDLIAAQKAAKVDQLRTEVRIADLKQRLAQEHNVVAVQQRVLAEWRCRSQPLYEHGKPGHCAFSAVVVISCGGRWTSSSWSPAATAASVACAGSPRVPGRGNPSASSSAAAARDP